MTDDCRNFEEIPSRGEGGRLTEIRIELHRKGYTFCCEHMGDMGRRCGEIAARWDTERGKKIINLCKRHGQPLIDGMKGITDITITGGYDDEPKSKLAEIKGRYDTRILEGTHKLLEESITDLIDYLIERERADGS